MHLEVVQEEGVRPALVLALEELEEEDEVLGGDGAVGAKELLDSALMADGRHDRLGLEAVGLLGDPHVAVVGVPCLGRGSGRSKR